jgi:hypothetical protein
LDNRIEGLLPSLSSNLISKILAIELYFLLTLSKSPIYFTLTDFLDSHSIEILYISVTIFLLAPWIFPLAIAAYVAVAGTPAWIARKLLGRLKWDGWPVFRMIQDRNREKAVSISITKDYAFRNNLHELTQRIMDHEAKQDRSMEGEATATTNFLLIVIIVLVSSQSAPNFLMKVTEVLEPYTGYVAYKVVVALLMIQGILGRMSGFHLLRDAGSLEPDFFRNEEERASAANWVNSMVERNQPYLIEWMQKNR